MPLMSHTLAVAGVLAIVATAAAAQARPDRPGAPDVRTAATVQRSVQPDLATVTLEFTADGATPAQAGSRLAGRADSVRRALATLGIPRDSLVNRSRWYWWRGRIETMPGLYRAHDAIEVRIRDLSKLGAVLDTAMGRGITDISGVNFTASDITAVQYDALREATVRARRQAETLAAASGLQLGRVLSLSTQADYAELYRSDDFGFSEATVATRTLAEGSATVVVQPSVTVSVTVYGRWELIPKP